VLEELSRHHRAYRVGTQILCTGIAVTIAVEAGQRFEAAYLQGVTEDVALNVALFHINTLGREPGIRHMRRTIMRRLMILLIFVIGLVVAPAPSAFASGSLTTSAVEVRGEVTTLVEQYEAIYGPRVSLSERADLQAMSREARRDMNTLVRLTRKAERTNKAGDWQRASRHYAAIRTKGDERLADAQDIIAPKMSLTEQLSAWSQARSVMADLDSLGAQLARRAG
jgi:hypothetical protein